MAGLLRQFAHAPEFRLLPLPGGANNRVYRVEATGGPFLLKSYFRHAADPRDRLGVEFAFTSFAWRHGLRAVPEPLACDPENGLALYGYVEGRRLQPAEVVATHVHQAAALFADLNRHRDTPAAVQLPPASEACFSLAEHTARVGRRIDRLLSIQHADGVDDEASTFVRCALAPAWQHVLDAFRRRARALNLDIDRPLGHVDRCLSPSDFGFHNALLKPSGTLCFLDFEYAGWDDPAKLVCDFFCQVAVSVPMAYFFEFARSVASLYPDSATCGERCALLLPVYQAKWCCILLNDFLPLGADRREFAQGGEHVHARKAAQLAKARMALATMLVGTNP